MLVMTAELLAAAHGTLLFIQKLTSALLLTFVMTAELQTVAIEA